MLMVETVKAIHLGLLHAAFNVVADPANWKNPINVVVPRRLVPTIVEAVGFFAGGGARVVPVPNGRARVIAPGYYAQIGA